MLDGIPLPRLGKALGVGDYSGYSEDRQGGRQYVLLPHDIHPPYPRIVKLPVSLLTS